MIGQRRLDLCEFTSQIRQTLDAIFDGAITDDESRRKTSSELLAIAERLVEQAIELRGLARSLARHEP